MTKWQRVRVPAGLFFGLAALYFGQPRPLWFGIGLAVAAIGSAIRIWAAGHLEKWRRLATSGPYRWTRNPLYAGSFLMGTGISIASTRLSILALFLLFFVIFYFPVMRREEQELQSSYGSKFEEYRSKVPIFFPALLPGRTMRMSDSNFSWHRVISNREHNAIIGLLGFLGLLGIKMLWT